MPLIGPVRFRGNYGYLSPSGEWAIEPKFEDLGLFSDGMASFSAGDKIGFVDELGIEVIPPVFDRPERLDCWSIGFSEGLAGVELNGRACYIDRAGKVKLDFDGSVLLWKFLKGQSLISSSVAGFRSLFPDGAIGPEIDVCDIPYFQPHDWNSIRCLVRMPGGQINAAAVNWKGEIVFPPTYRDLGEFHNGVAEFGVEDGGLVGLVKFDGTVVKEPVFISIGKFCGGLAPASIARKQVGFINEFGELTIAPMFQQACPFSDGLACVTVKNGRPGNKGFIDVHGEMTIEPQFRKQTSFEQGFARVEFKDQIGIIDRTGKVIWKRPLEQNERVS